LTVLVWYFQWTCEIHISYDSMQTGLLHSKFAVSDWMRAIAEYLNLKCDELLARWPISLAVSANVYVVTSPPPHHPQQLNGLHPVARSVPIKMFFDHLIFVWVVGFGAHPASCPMGTGGKAAGGVCQCRGQENVELYIHSPIRLRGVVLN
jgi:hypothetical protein